jgi:hypothetical protein
MLIIERSRRDFLNWTFLVFPFAVSLTFPTVLNCLLFLGLRVIMMMDYWVTAGRKRWYFIGGIL